MILGGAYESSHDRPGTDHHMRKLPLQAVDRKRKAAPAKAALTEMPLYNCTTNSEDCSVESISAETLPWASHLARSNPNPT